jgi:hypothetical protein
MSISAYTDSRKIFFSGQLADTSDHKLCVAPNLGDAVICLGAGDAIHAQATVGGF